MGIWELSALGGLAAIGVLHGINPAMGWLFAVFFALHRGGQRALWLALGAVGLGHLVALALSLALLLVASSTVPIGPLRVAAGAGALALGAGRLLSWWRHPRWRGLNLGYGELVLWATVMGLLHGGGLAFAPLVLHEEGRSALDVGRWALPTAVHGVTAIATMAACAVIVQRWLGLMALRRYWFNFDLAWGVALIVIGLAVLLMPRLSPLEGPAHHGPGL
jgi:hypothetical protein